jgi:hypothetical protein
LSLTSSSSQDPKDDPKAADREKEVPDAVNVVDYWQRDEIRQETEAGLGSKKDMQAVMGNLFPRIGESARIYRHSAVDRSDEQVEARPDCD